MPDLQGSTSITDHKGRHYELIKNRIHPVFQSVSLRNTRELGRVEKAPEPWIKTATALDQSRLQKASLELWSSRNQVDRFLEQLQNVYEFAEPLLTDALKKLDIDVDVKKTYLHLYLPKELPWYVIDMSGGVVTHTVSLIDAALHNFARGETCEPDSDFISQPDQRGQFDVLPLKHKLSIARFQTLCRELDIGARYTRYLEEQLLQGDRLARYWLQSHIVESEKAAFRAAVEQATMAGDVDADARDMVIEMLEGQRNTTWKGKPVQFADLSILDGPLTGIMLITADLEQSHEVMPVIAYVPQDPQHPLKQYPSPVAFMNELMRQLRDDALIASTGMTYRQFFSRFVDHSQRGHFFGGLQQRLFAVKWHRKEPFDPGPSWREVPIDNPRLSFDIAPITGDLWVHLYQNKLNKILNDARDIAVSTADTDSKARWAWWDNFKKIASDIFNVALLISTPFVPGLGELMLAYTAYQLTSDVIEGAVDLAEGLWAEAADHVVGVVTDVVQLAAFAAGASIADAFRLKISVLVEGMQPVSLPTGETRLWHPDIEPYAHPSLTLPTDSRPDRLGLHRHQGRDILPLEGRHYVTRKDPQTAQYRLEHPTRPEAYAPKLSHNGRGAWRHEGENPLTWEHPKLMHRLGHMTDGLNSRQLENIRLISGTEEDALRRMHVENAEPPLLLEDTVNRFRAMEDVAATTTQIRSGSPIDPSSHWFEQLITELPGWPSDHALRVYERSDLLGASRLYGNANARPERTLEIGLADVMAGRLPERVVRFLGERQLEALVGPGLSRQAKVQRLRDRLADQVDGRKTNIADYIYRFRARSTNRRVQVMQRQYPELPTIIAERLVANARQDDLRIVDAQQRLPLDLKSRVRECAFETRSTRASEGFYQAERLTADTERLALNALRFNSEGLRDLRVEVRDGTAEGPLRCSVGPDDATQVRLLLRVGDDRYEVVDGQHRSLSDTVDFHEALLRALPVQARRSIGYGLGQGQAFKQWIMAKTMAPAERRTLLLEPFIRPVAELETSLLLCGPTFSRQPVTLEQRMKNLYPHLREHDVDNFIRSMPPGTDPVQLLKNLKQELIELENILAAWKIKNTPFEPDNTLLAPREITFIADRLMECFQRKPLEFGERSTHFDKGYALDLSSESLSFNLEPWWKTLPQIRPYLEQISTLSLDGVKFSPGSTGLLKDFARLRHLSARRCHLTRLPENVASMHLLETLRLSYNLFELDDAAVERLKHLTYLQTLRLDNNPLRRPPNVERMPRLKVLNLSNTGIDNWPDGLLSKHRPKGFFLDLRNNPIKTVPTVVNGSRQALVVARARLDIDSLHDTQRQLLFQYRDSSGLPRQNTYAPLAANARAKWPVDDDSSLWGANSPGLGTYRAEAWDNLMNEPNSDGFFKIIDSLTDSADFRAGGATRKALSRRVWELIDAVDLDTPLREKLFQTAEQPTTCADASSEVFNTMGIQALASQAYSYTTNAAELEARLVSLSKGAARLQRVNDIARADALSRPSRVEEVEIYLAYQTRLASRLELPWQSEGMLYQQIAAVSDNAIEQAYVTVLALEQGDGLLDVMLEQPFWDQYLRETHDLRFRSNDRAFDEKLRLLEQRREAGEINEQAYSDSLNTLADEKLQLGRSLTRMLLDKHAL
ncbi:NEL-type E3 ubiquitin ligase domain-containing protein [Pseudomonas sp. PGPR40]|uniref:NEL-type E3 ubiquitin ligase domain-containing protein n=1 Tax=Pseudomonas sp. PGPR40 TaxID=2913476 RepID=UPI001EDAD48A|nr:NEL-type E3 ubiquitin ligase domain-containing protein [Pseudomonas sp. PGPR40]